MIADVCRREVRAPLDGAEPPTAQHDEREPHVGDVAHDGLAHAIGEGGALRRQRAHVQVPRAHARNVRKVLGLRKGGTSTSALWM